MATKRKVSDMLTPTLTGFAFIFFSHFSSVKGNEELLESHLPYDSLVDLIANFKESCLEYEDPLFCLYWDSNELTDFTSPKVFKSKKTEKSTAQNCAREKEFPEERSLEVQSPENHLNKILPALRKKNPVAREYKRGPGFRSWGGKRDSKVSEENRNKRHNFGSWGGKRDGEYFPADLSISSFEDWGDKRAKFQSWEDKISSTNTEKGKSPTTVDPVGKRGSVWKDRFYLSELFKKHVPKRPQFQSWGGKRAIYPWDKILGFTDSQPPNYSTNGGEKRKFSSWRGTRYDNSNLIKHMSPNWEDKRLTSGEDSEMESTSGPKESSLNDNPTHISKNKMLKPNWESGEPDFNAIAWIEKEKEGRNTR